MLKSRNKPKKFYAMQVLYIGIGGAKVEKCLGSRYYVLRLVQYCTKLLVVLYSSLLKLARNFQYSLYSLKRVQLL